MSYGSALDARAASPAQASISPPLISIVVINHNYGAFLAAAIESALRQDYGRVEIIVVDDGSTDNSRDIIARFADQVGTVLKSRGGHVSAFNEGFARSRGEIVIFLDADDLLYPACASTIAAAWEPTLAKIQCRLDTIDRDGADQHMPFPYFTPDMTPAWVLDQALTQGVYPWTVSTGNAYARGFLARLLPIVTDQPISPDGYVNKLAPLYGGVKSLAAILGAYRVHGGNVWAQSGRAVKLPGLTRSVWLNAWNHEQFEAHARSAGYRVAAYEDIDVPQQLELRLISLRLLPEAHPFAADTRGGLLRRGLRGARRAPGLSAIGRVAWSVWFVLLALAPKRLVRTMFQVGRSQMNRGGLARLLVRLSRGGARHA